MRKLRLFKITLIAATALLSASLFESSANAAWGNGCTSSDHCYALTEWAMSGSGNGGGEEVMGLASEIYTTAMLVPEWAKGRFVTNEQWMVGPNGGWAEDGQLGGYDGVTEEGHEVNDDSLHWFYAFSIGEPAKYSVYVAPWTVGGYEWNSYYEEDEERNGWWCARIGSESHPVACDGYFKPYATRVEMGMEAGDGEQPENAGKSRTSAQWTEGVWHRWEKAKDEVVSRERQSESGYICINKYESVPGAIEWGTPPSNWPC
jgi:hypothetical protein